MSSPDGVELGGRYFTWAELGDLLNYGVPVWYLPEAIASVSLDHDDEGGTRVIEGGPTGEAQPPPVSC